MGLSYHHTFLIFIFFQIQFSKSLSSSPPLIPPRDPLNHFECSYHQSVSLFHFKQQLIIDPSLSCYGQSFEATTMSWNMSVDCCKWKGVTCDPFNGYVIGLDLSCSQLTGTIHPNNSLFQLSHLKQLNLAFNNFYPSTISPRFGRFASLTHLNLSYSNFKGNVPSEISLLSNLVSLDLSYNEIIQIERNNFQLILQNLTQLRELSLAFVNLYSAKFPLNFSSALTLLDLSATGLQGIILIELLHLPNLHKLRLNRNFGLNLIGLSPNETNVSISSPLRYLDLSSCNFSGTLPQWLGNLTRITHLDLSLNDFSGGLMPNVFAKLQMLRLLDLSSCSLTGPFPSSIGSLTQLLVLSLSNNLLTGAIPSSIGNLSQLISLILSENSLTGAIPSSIGNISQLIYLILSENSLTGAIPSSIGNISQLIYLILSENSLTGAIPSSIGNISQLIYLILSENSLTGAIPSSIGNISQLIYLILSENSLTGGIPSSIGNLTQLVMLSLDDNSLTGAIPSSIGNLTQLVELSLYDNSLTGVIPSSIGNLMQLVDLDFSNNSLTGDIPTSIGLFTQITSLSLSNNLLNGTIPSLLFTHPSLKSLDLASNRFSGPFQEFQNNFMLNAIYLEYNQLSGHIPHSISRLVNLQVLELSRNKFTGIVELNMFSNLSILDLSYNNISVRTTKAHINTTSFPNLLMLRLSSCKVEEIPYLLWSTKTLRVLELRQNSLQGPLPSNICNLTNLETLDLSLNNFSGEIPPCLGNFSDNLSVLNLRGNKLFGNIPTTFGKNNNGKNIKNLNFNENRLGGKLPRSLSNCINLEVLDLGNNHLNDTFPAWLGTLLDLKVLVLKSNRFHGNLPNNGNKKPFFSKLRIIDLSNNEFSGFLPSKYFRKFKAMMHSDENIKRPVYMRDVNYEYSVTLVVKGMELELVKILTVFTTIDMSNNKFDGGIPNFIGNLSALRGLNLSQNKLVGHIPPLLGNLSLLESLDLSFNHLDGQIPQQLTDLTSLEVLNLSENSLSGRIPQGKQFNTFKNSSYIGNSALCGFPLSKDCGGDETQNKVPPPKLEEDDDSDFEDGFTWKAVSMGYGCGTVFGLAMGYLMFLIGKPKWVIELVEHYEYKNRTRRGRQRRNGRRN